jgi:hypothetical protein
VNRLRTTPEGQFEVVIENPADNCHALAMSPSEMEEELRQGPWVVLLIAIWSVSDVDAIEQAVRLGQQFGEKIQIGMRAFDHHKETERWCSGVKEQYRSPIWLFLLDGETVAELVGHVTEEDLRRQITYLLSRNAKFQLGTGNL